MSARLPIDQGVLSDLVALTGDDMASASEAFSRLWDVTRPAIVSHLVRRGILPDEAEDAVQDLANSLWRFRGRLRARSRGEWFKLAYRSAIRMAVRRRRSVRDLREPEADWAIPKADLPYLEATVVARIEERRIFEAADRLWLGEAEDAEDVEIGAAALRLVLVDGMPPEEAVTLFGADLKGFTRWMENPAVLARALHSGLCWSGEALAGYVLRPERPLTGGEIDDLMRSAGTAIPLEAWTPEEARVVCWRLRNAMDEERLLSASQGAFDREALDALLDRIRHAIPLRDLAASIRTILQDRGLEGALAHSGLWKRTAFECHARQDLPHRQILEREGPPAEVSQYPLNASKLNNWLSVGRLYSQLAAFLQEDV